MSEENLDTLIERAVLRGNKCNEEIFKELRQCSLLQLVKKMGIYLTSDEHVDNALVVLSRAAIRRSCITNEEVEVLMRFFSEKLSVKTVITSVDAIAVLVKDLSSRGPCSGVLFTCLLNNFLGHIRFQALPLEARMRGMEVLAFMISKETVPFVTTQFLQTFLDSVDGESEPVLVLRVFELHFLLITHVNESAIGSLLEDYFDSLSSYFPIVFSQPLGCPVTKEDLKKALMRCMTLPRYVECCVPFLLSRLSSPSSVVKQEAITVLLEFFLPESTCSIDNLSSHFPAIITHIRNEITKVTLHGYDDANPYLHNCLKLLRCVGKNAHYTSSKSVMTWLEPIASGFLASLNCNQLTCAAYSTMLYHLASSDVCCGTALVHYWMKSLLIDVESLNAGNDNKFLVLSALFAGLLELRVTGRESHGDVSSQDILKESLKECNGMLFSLTDNISMYNLEPASRVVRCEFLSSLLGLATWLDPWMPDDNCCRALESLILSCLAFDDDELRKKMPKCVSCLALVEEKKLRATLINVFNDEDKRFHACTVLKFFEGIMISSTSNAILAMEFLLTPSKLLSSSEVQYVDAVSLCRRGLVMYDNLPEDGLIRVAEKLARKESTLNFELLCELLTKIPSTRIREISRDTSSEMSVFRIAVLSSCAEDVFGVRESAMLFASYLLDALTIEGDSRYFALQGISALSMHVPSIHEFLMNTLGEKRTEINLIVQAAIARGLQVSGTPCLDVVQKIVDGLVTEICNGEDKMKCLTYTFFRPASLTSPDLLKPFVESSQKISSPVPLNLLKAITLLLTTETQHAEYNWSALLNFVQSALHAEPSMEVVLCAVELINCVYSRVSTDKTFILIFLISDKTIFYAVLNNIQGAPLRTRCSSLNLLSEVATILETSSSTSTEENRSCSADGTDTIRMLLKGLRSEVLQLTQAALSDHKRVVRLAASKCRHRWFKLC